MTGLSIAPFLLLIKQLQTYCLQLPLMLCSYTKHSTYLTLFFHLFIWKNMRQRKQLSICWFIPPNVSNVHFRQVWVSWTNSQELYCGIPHGYQGLKKWDLPRLINRARTREDRTQTNSLLWYVGTITSGLIHYTTTLVLRQYDFI